jgi:hypothetical protein
MLGNGLSLHGAGDHGIQIQSEIRVRLSHLFWVHTSVRPEKRVRLGAGRLRLSISRLHIMMLKLSTEKFVNRMKMLGILICVGRKRARVSLGVRPDRD